jgi:dolichyl-phosphate-mannose--protein O-mannosyl transferase
MGNIPPNFIKISDKDILQLRHVKTLQMIFAHNVRPYTSDDKELNQVAAHPFYNQSSELAKNNWQIQVEGGGEVVGMKSRLRFLNPTSNCHMFTKSFLLPRWGFGHQEVLCSKKARKALKYWRIEDSFHPNRNYDIIIRYITSKGTVQSDAIL